MFGKKSRLIKQLKAEAIDTSYQVSNFEEIIRLLCIVLDFTANEIEYCVYQAKSKQVLELLESKGYWRG